MPWPVEIQVSVIGAVFAVAGYMVKSGIDWWQNKRKERARTIAQLQRLQSLLNGAWTVYSLQQNKVKYLMQLLENNHQAEYRAGGGYEKTMARCYPVANNTEKELHSIIRAYTQHSMRRVNLELTEWLRSDVLFKTGVVATRRRKQLAGILVALETHLLLWHAKFESWIPDEPKHALVYMADEEHHGLGFPKGQTIKLTDGRDIYVPSVETEVDLALEDLRGKWKWFSRFGKKWAEWKRYLRASARSKSETHKPTRM